MATKRSNRWPVMSATCLGSVCAAFSAVGLSQAMSGSYRITALPRKKNCDILRLMKILLRVSVHFVEPHDTAWFAARVLHDEEINTEGLLRDQGSTPWALPTPPVPCLRPEVAFVHGSLWRGIADRLRAGQDRKDVVHFVAAYETNGYRLWEYRGVVNWRALTAGASASAELDRYYLDMLVDDLEPSIRAAHGMERAGIRYV